MTKKALRNMMGFHQDMTSQFADWGMDFKSNLGRRNVVMSQTQEHFFARELSKEFSGVSADGRTGKADIVIGEIGKELECKLTSGRASGGYDLQTDLATLKKKGSLDYLYVIANEDFTEFTVLFYEGLTPDDFHPAAPGSRGKARMKKGRAMKKCNVLFGEVVIRNHTEVDKLSSQITAAQSEYVTRRSELTHRLGECSSRAVKKKQKIQTMMKNNKSRLDAREDKLFSKLDFWIQSPPQVGFRLEAVTQ
jgi:hypothetical protein